MEKTDEILLQVEDLKTYFFTRRGIVRAVDGATFSIKKSETLGLVGESGCGKTITALSILRLIPEPAGRIVEGSIIFEGEDLLRKSARELRKIRGKKISIILQDPLTSLNPAFTIGEQIGETIRLHQHIKGRSLQERVIESLKLVRLPAVATRTREYPHQMSGGMRQRVTGAIALSCQPSLLIADEPTTSLDVTLQAQYLRLLKNIQEETKIAMMFITHDFGVVAEMCDTVAVMYAGKIVEKAETRELFDNPHHPYASALMNCLPNIEIDTPRLANIGGQPPDLHTPLRGCNFAPRCPKAQACCEEEEPQEIMVGRNHFVSCWYPNR